MRRRTWAGLGIGATVTLALTAVLNGPAGAPGAAAAELEPFSGCEELRQWYVDAALPHVTAWGLGGGPVMPLAVAEARGTLDSSAPQAGYAEEAVTNGPTGTNVQEAGVDEPDVAKTDGSILAHVKGDRVVLNDVTGQQPRKLATLPLPRDLGSAELLLVGDKLVVLASAWQHWGGPIAADVTPGRSILPDGGSQGMTRALVVDVSDPSSPRVVEDTSFDGSLVSARQYDDVVRLVVSTTSPRIDFVEPRRGRTPREAKAENRRLVRESTIEDWLPMVESDGSSSTLVDCQDIAHPEASSGYGTVSVVAFDPDEPDERRTTGVTTSSDIVYSSTDRLYLAASSFGWWTDGPKQQPTTGVHAFALDGLATDYVASADVPGQVRDRWSMSEHDGYLRVAAALGKNPWDPEENAVIVLEERGSSLAEVGRVGQMGIKERIQSVRWFGDVAVVVTFRQIDPLYTLDLSDAVRPRVVGELKIPGFSSYLHPLGGDLLLGLGQDATLEGRTRGAQAAVFDIADLADPRRVETMAFGPSTDFAAAWDPRAFTYLPEQRTAFAALNDWKKGARIVALRVGEEGRLTRRASHDVPDGSAGLARALPLPDGRVALVAGGTLELWQS